MPLVDNSVAGDRSSFRLRRIGTPATFPGVSDTFKINKEITVVGRNPSSSDIFLDSNKNKVMISRLHARIITDTNNTGKQTFKISDTSLNGTYVNDVKIADSCDLQPGDTVTFGHLRGAVLTPGVQVQQPDSEFRFQFEKYPSTPPNKKQRTSDYIPSSPEFQRKVQTPSPPVLKLAGPKTPLVPVALMPDLSAFLTPVTPGHLAASPTDKSRLPADSIYHTKQKWRQHFVSESSDSEHSDDDLKAYAAAAGGAMDDSDEDIFSVQLPDSPESYDEPGASSCSTSYAAETSCQPPMQDNREGAKDSTVKELHTGPNKVASKRPRKRNLTYKKAARKSSKSSDSGHDQDNFMYNTCASVDCIHPHDKEKLVDWVQCDDCDDWYHVKCTGLTLKSVRPKSAKFHCGCV